MTYIYKRIHINTHGRAQEEMWSDEDYAMNGYPLPYKREWDQKMNIPIPMEFLQKYPDMPKPKAVEKWQKYLKEMRKVFLKRLPFMNDNQTSIGTKKLRDDCGRFYPYGKKGDRYSKKETVYVYNEFYPLYPFYSVTKQGSNLTGKNSEIVIINQKLIDLLIDTADHEELVSIYFDDLSEEVVDQLHWVNIDMQSLSNYIKSTNEKLTTIDERQNPTYYYKLLKNLRQAKYIKIITEFFDQDQFPMKKKISLYGRTYYEGLNLQNCTKEVRNAALGNNHQYDLEAAVYAIKMMLIDDIYTEKNIDLVGHYIYTKEYLDHKSDIRNRLAKHIQAYPDPIKLVKEAITAIGFGAKISGGAWLEGTTMQFPAINDIIMNQEDRDRFLNDPWVIEFYKEQKKLTNEITDYYKNKVNWCDSHLKNLPRSTNKLGKYRKTAIMSYLFQTLETMIIQQCTKHLDEDNILLLVHDCIITQRPLNGYDLSELRYTLQNISHFLKITNEYNRGWLDIDTMSYEIMHKNFILQEELKANNGIMPVTYKKSLEQINNYDDYECYDGYDTGSRHEEYEPDYDECVNYMTESERLEHYRIIGYKPNQLPDHINKLLGENK